MSEAHKQYLKKKKKQELLLCICRIILFLSFLCLWEYCSDSGIIDSFFFSSPSAIFDFIKKTVSNGDMLSHIRITLLETIASFSLVTLLTIALASLLWSFRPLAKLLEPAIIVLNSLPKSALAPLIIVWLGSGISTIIIAGISVAIFGSISTLYTVYTQTDEQYITLIKTLGGNQLQIFTKVVFPFGIPAFLNLLKVNIGLSLVGVIIGEFLAARKGLGYLIIYGTQTFKLDMVISSIVILCIIAYFLFLIVQKIEKPLLKHFQNT